jgi:hypothetical protein
LSSIQTKIGVTKKDDTGLKSIPIIFKKKNLSTNLIRYIMIKKTTEEISKEFMALFPEIKSLQIEYIEKGKGYGTGLRDEDYQRRVLTEKVISERIRCSNQLCYNGGLFIDHILDDMVHDKETHWEGTEICKGYEGSKKSRTKYRDCLNSFKLKINIEYKK